MVCQLTVLQPRLHCFTLLNADFEAQSWALENPVHDGDSAGHSTLLPTKSENILKLCFEEDTAVALSETKTKGL